MQRKHLRSYFLPLAVLLIAWASATIARDIGAEVQVRKIWDSAPHNAFTDLIRFKGAWYCVFREGKAHVSPDGALRVLRSSDGETWESSALISAEDSDLRDAKITVTPQGELMLCGAGALHDKAQHTHQSYAWFSQDGQNWSEAVPIGEPDFWLWRVTWHEGVAYGIGYSVREDRSVRLYRSSDGRKFDVLVERLYDDGWPNESSIVFTGHRSDVREVMAVSDVVVSCSTDPEAFGRVTLEALSLGKPVAAYNHGGVAEQLEELMPEGRVPLRDIAAMTSLLARWYSDRPAPLRTTDHSFTLERFWNSVLSVYEDSVLRRAA